MYLAGAAGRLNAVTTNFDWKDRFNIWSGLIGGTFLFLSYFGCDQSQVQRYLTGKSIAESRLSLLFNAVAKIPMQFFILFIGAMVFVFYLFVQPPLLFQHAELERMQNMRGIPADAGATTSGRTSAENRRRWLWRRRTTRGDPRAEERQKAEYRAAQKELNDARGRAAQLVEQTGGEKGFSDTNYIFLSFVTKYLPAGRRRTGDRGDLRGDHVGEFRRDQFAGDGDRGGPVQAIPSTGRDRPSLSVGVALADAVLGRAGGGVRKLRQEAGLADCGGESGGLAVLRVAAGMLRGGVLLPPRAAAPACSSACWRARPRSSRRTI